MKIDQIKQKRQKNETLIDELNQLKDQLERQSSELLRFKNENRTYSKK